MAEKKEFSITILEEEPVVKQKVYRKKGFTVKMVEQFLDGDGNFAEIKLLGDKEAVAVARTLGRVIKKRYSDRVEYLGRDDKKNVVYLKRK